MKSLLSMLPCLLPHMGVLVYRPEYRIIVLHPARFLNANPSPTPRRARTACASTTGSCRMRATTRAYRAIQELPANSGLKVLPISLPIIDDTDVVPTRQLICGQGYRFHAAELGSRAVVIKVFSGMQALDDWDAETAPATPGPGWLMQKDRYPNFLRAMGRLYKASPDLYIVYHGGAEDSAERMLASILRGELSRCIFLALTMSALSYLKSKEYPLEHAKCTNFDLLIGGNGNIQICMNTSPSSQHINPRTRKGVYSQVASDFDNKDETNLPLAMSTFPTADTTFSNISRRELGWKSSEKNADLDAISQRVGIFLFRLRSWGSVGGLRRFPAHDKGQTCHRCSGYFREEVVLGAQCQNSGVLSYTTPSPRETCTICGNLAHVGGWFRYKCGKACVRSSGYHVPEKARKISYKG
ncbi:hypothetical protein C8R43DRAFT_942659 [Mycena crocata]|nr:hypothetical protein C8R43DRAFT_942659 [Mycena crocata]